MTPLLLAPILAPVAASMVNLVAGWRRASAALTVLSAVTVPVGGAVLAFRVQAATYLALGGLLRADALTATMLIVIGAVGTLTSWASIGYIDAEIAAAHTDARGARLYGFLAPAFLSAMVVALCANNIGVMLGGDRGHHHRHRVPGRPPPYPQRLGGDVEIRCDLLGRHRDGLPRHGAVVLRRRHAGALADNALDLDVLAARAGSLDPGVARLAGGLLLIGYGAKAGLFPFHTWLADAHSQAPAPVSALMSGVLLSVAFSVLIRVKPIIDAAAGATFCAPDCSWSGWRRCQSRS